MIRIPIVLDSWGLGTKLATLGTVEIINDGTSTNPARGHYDVRIIGKHGRVIRTARVENWPRKSKSVFALMRKALTAAGYGS